MGECKHDKVYAPFVVATNPPIYLWVCSKCKEKGEDKGNYYDGSGMTYYELLKG